MQLFRQEVVDHANDRRFGDVSIALPVSWQIIGYLLFAAAVSALLFLGMASYTRVELARGKIVPGAGVLEIAPTAPGVITGLAVTSGAAVAANQPLVWITPAESARLGGEAQGKLIEILRVRERELSARSVAAAAISAAEQSRLDEQKRGLDQEITQLSQQIRLQDELVSVVAGDLKRVSEIAERGFASEREVSQRQRVLLEAQQRHADLNGTRDAKKALLMELAALRLKREAEGDAEGATLRGQLAEIAKELVRERAAESYSINAPVAGTVTAISARVGQSVQAGAALMVVLPAGTKLRAELLIPGQAIGFIAPGQSVKLAMDAFAYQTFGVVNAHIVDVSVAPMPETTGSRVVDANSGYIAVAELAQTEMMAFGRPRPLLPGMSFQARIATRQQTLIEWLFEPLFAVGRR